MLFVVFLWVSVFYLYRSTKTCIEVGRFGRYTHFFLNIFTQMWCNFWFLLIAIVYSFLLYPFTDLVCCVVRIALNHWPSFGCSCKFSLGYRFPLFYWMFDTFSILRNVNRSGFPQNRFSVWIFFGGSTIAHLTIIVFNVSMHFLVEFRTQSSTSTHTHIKTLLWFLHSVLRWFYLN